MIVNVHMTTGECFQFASRKDLRTALGREPGEDQRAVEAFVRWQSDDPSWTKLRAAYVRKHSVAFVVAAADVAQSEADLPMKDVADARAARWQEKQDAEPVAA